MSNHEFVCPEFSELLRLISCRRIRGVMAHSGGPHGAHDADSNPTEIAALFDADVRAHGKVAYRSGFIRYGACALLYSSLGVKLHQIIFGETSLGGHPPRIHFG